jgi:hypothetical protein
MSGTTTPPTTLYLKNTSWIFEILIEPYKIFSAGSTEPDRTISISDRETTKYAMNMSPNKAGSVFKGAALDSDRCACPSVPACTICSLIAGTSLKTCMLIGRTENGRELGEVRHG